MLGKGKGDQYTYVRSMCLVKGGLKQVKGGLKQVKGGHKQWS